MDLNGNACAPLWCIMHAQAPHHPKYAPIKGPAKYFQDLARTWWILRAGAATVLFTEEDKTFIKIFVPGYGLWTTKTYDRVPW